MERSYSSPVDKLLTQGDCRESHAKWPDYLKLGFTHEHVPELIRMVLDEDLNWADSDSLEVWAPIHAWRTLAQLKASAAVEPLLGELYKIDDEDDDWIIEEFPKVFELIGPPAIDALEKYLKSNDHGVHARICAASSLRNIGKAYLEERDQCVKIFTKLLTNARKNDPTLNGFLISDLVDLQATESLEIIRSAFDGDYVDLFIMGDFEDVEIYMGVRTQRSTPPPRFELFKEDAFSIPGLSKKSKTGRNDPCPCGSGKKYKKCCWKKEQIATAGNL